MTERTTTYRSSSTRRRRLALSAAAGLAALGCTGATASLAGAAPPDTFTQTNLVANNASYGAKLVDPDLTNAWGLANGPDPLWVSDNNSGDASVYSGGINGSAVTLDLTVPIPGGNPTGQVENPTTSFPVGSKTGSPAAFIVSSDSIGATQSPGEIAAWNGGASFVVEDSPTGGAGGKTPAHAVFKGLALSPTSDKGPQLYAADVANARVDVFNKDFAPEPKSTDFTDPAIPADYAPFGIQLLDGKLYVAYGKQNGAKNNVVPGAGFGDVDVYSVNGKLLKHLISGGSSSPLNEPWGMTIAPAGFGPFAGDLLVGNLGNGWINAFNPTTGAFLGVLDTTEGAGWPVTINGLWGLTVGNSAFGGANSVVFSAGPSGYNDGLVGVLDPAS
jgi:uncharacterized protein (TIGR03118 family)